MGTDLAAAQPLLIGLLLLWSSYHKFKSPTEADRTALPKLVGTTNAKPAYLAVGAIEALTALALLAPPSWVIEKVAAVALFAGFTAFLVYSKIVVPEASCGCAGKSAKPVGYRAIVRAMLLLATALVADGNWWSAGPALAILVPEAIIFVMLSAELDRYWLLPLRRFRLRLSHPLAGTATSTAPLAATQRRLILSPAYRSVDGLLRSDIRDYWDDEDWRYVSYTARYDGRPATAVFAVPHHDSTPESIRVAVVEETSGLTLYRTTALAAV
ncbi:MauE/DoxX family redox-associated membrane protein [Kribbella sp. NPDC026611]|uniref:MauE/DoxX family redox-associated membrane protein n=1 Tax=Kribbella sp. NPDC026611 TaxID=3154911 RepID=UPI003408B4B1